MGDKLAVSPKGECPPDFADILRAHKRELLDWLEGKSLPPDCVPWLHIARQVLAGEFGSADSSTVASLTIGLRRIDHPHCRAALDALPDNPEKVGNRKEN
jgi:hypothetical protein